MTALLHVMGPPEYLDEAGNAVDHDNVFLRLDCYAKHCQEIGLDDAFVRSLVR